MTDRKVGSFGEEGKPRKLERDQYKWYRRDPSRALAGMRELNIEQRGVYCTLIELVYEARGPIADNDVSRAHDCKCNVRTYRRIKTELIDMERIVVDEEAGTIYDERAIRELVKADMLSERQSRRGKKSARVKADNVVALRAIEGGKAITASNADQTPDDSPMNRPIIGRNRERTPNEINAPSSTIRVRSEIEEKTGGEITQSRARPAASPPLQGGGGPSAKDAKKAARAAALAALELKRDAHTDEEASNEPSVGASEPGDRKAVRT